MASLAPALERMPQLTSLDLSSARIGIGRGVERGGLHLAWVCAVGFGCAALWCAERLRAGIIVVRDMCAEGRRMDADNEIGDAGMASLAPALERMPQLTSLDLKSAQIGPGEAWSVGACILR